MKCSTLKTFLTDQVWWTIWGCFRKGTWVVADLSLSGTVAFSHYFRGIIIGYACCHLLLKIHTQPGFSLFHCSWEMHVEDSTVGVFALAAIFLKIQTLACLAYGSLGKSLLTLEQSNKIKEFAFHCRWGGTFEVYKSEPICKCVLRVLYFDVPLGWVTSKPQFNS